MRFRFHRSIKEDGLPMIARALKRAFKGSLAGIADRITLAMNKTGALLSYLASSRSIALTSFRASGLVVDENQSTSLPSLFTRNL